MGVFNKALIAITATACAAGFVSAASAQNVGDEFRRDRNVGVRDRARPDYDAIGIREGSFLLLPKVTAGLREDDNIFATQTGAKSDTIETISPELQAISTWSRNSLRLFARSQYENYNSNGTESNTTYAFGGAGQYDIARDLALVASADFQHLIEPRTASGTPTSAKNPIQYNQTDFELGAAKAFNRFRVKGTFDYENLHYFNGDVQSGSTINVDGSTITFVGSTVGDTVIVNGSTVVLNGKVLQDYRDESIYKVTARGEYAISPDKSVFLEVSTENRDFRNVPFEDSGINRNSTGTRIQVGADFDLTQLMRGTFQVGYLDQNFADTRTADFSGLGAKALIQYFPTQLTTLTFRGSREVADSGLVTTPAFLTTNVGAQVDHELLRNVILTARFDYGKDEYRGIDRNDDRFSGSAGFVYLLNHSVGVNLLYSHLTQNSYGVDRGAQFDINRVTASLVLQR